MTTMKAYCIEHGDVRFAPLPTSKVAPPVNSDNWCKVCLDRYYRGAEANVPRATNRKSQEGVNFELLYLWHPSNPWMVLDLSWLKWFQLCMN